MPLTSTPSVPRAASVSRLVIDDATTDEDRVVRGFVLDLHGDPVAGARVRLSDMLDDLDWITTSDSGGAFAFVGAPSSPLKVEASLEASADMVWVTSGTDEAEVELVLEPTAIIRVIGRPGQAGTAEVRCPSDACFGGGAPWQGGFARSPDKLQLIMNPDRKLLTEIFADVPDEPIRFVPILVPGAGPVVLDLPPAEYDPNDFPPEDPFRAYGDASRWTLVAEGALREDLEVTADLSYDVFVVTGSERVACGSVRPAPGEVLEVPCSAGRVEVNGRAIDADGTPRAGLELTLQLYDNSRSGLPDDQTATATSDAAGRFTFTLDVPGAMHGSIKAEGTLGSVGAVSLVPGTTRDVGDIAFHDDAITPAQTRALLLDPWGPVGASFGNSAHGARVMVVREGGPLELAGVEAEDVLLRVDGRSVVDADDLRRLLAGPHGSTITLRVRSHDGALADVVITRDTRPPDQSELVEVERAALED